MLVLHAAFAEQRFLFWGETSPGLPAGRPRRSRSAAVAALPFNTGPSTLEPVLTDAAGIAARSLPGPEAAVVWLPTVKGQPVASSPLVAEPPVVEAALAPWSITVLPLPAEQAIDLLCACVGKETLGPGVLVGKTLAYWALALRLAGAFVAREQFLPGVADGDETLARWQPLLTSLETQRVAHLAQAMPPACRAIGSADLAPETPAALVLRDFLNFAVDGLVRTPQPTRSASRRTAPGSVHDAWLSALRDRDETIAAPVTQRSQLVEQIRDWRRPLELTADAPFRLSFRLEEPADEQEKPPSDRDPAKWYLRYLLQAADDPSLLYPVADAWAAKGRKAALLKRGDFNAREYLLSTLGQAASLYSPIEQSLQMAAPAGCELDATAAHAFLTEKASALEQAGFGVLFPAWWSRKGTKLRLSARAHVKSPKMQGGSGFSLEELVTFDWQLALGDSPVSLTELEALARLKAPLVRLRGQWVQLSPEEIQAAIDFWKTQPQGEATVRDLVQMALGRAKTPAGLAFAGVGADGWIGGLLDKLEGRTTFEELPPPPGLAATLRPYQQRGYSWLGFLRQWGLGACLADDMGLGKTVQTLALFQREREQNEKRPVLLVCPMSVMGNWRKEAERFTPELPVLVHHGQTRKKGAAFHRLVEEHALVVTSYAILHLDQELFAPIPWAGVVLDEAQNIKNPGTKQAQAARAVKADYRLALTGTPVENHVGDLWSIMEFLNPGFLGSQAEFRRTFFVPIQASRDTEAAERLKRLTGPFILRRLKTDKSVIADLPEKLEMKVFCNLTKEQASLYAAVVEEANQALKSADEGIKRKGLILATLSKLKQVCNHPRQLLGDNSSISGRSGKLARLTEMLEEVLSVGEKALIFTQFSEMGEILRRHLEETFGREVLFLHGGTSRKQRDEMVRRFQATEGETPALFLLSLKAGGTGLNLTAANHVFHFDRWWNPAVENQATDRAFRIGQTRAVQVHKFLCVGTLEERIDEMIERKQAIAEKVVGTGEGWLTELSNEQLRDLFALRDSALGE